MYLPIHLSTYLIWGIAFYNWGSQSKSAIHRAGSRIARSQMEFTEWNASLWGKVSALPWRSFGSLLRPTQILQGHLSYQSQSIRDFNCIFKIPSQTDRQSRFHAWDRCSGLVHWDDCEGWDGEGRGRGVQDGEHMYTHGWFMSVYGTNHYTIVR